MFLPLRLLASSLKNCEHSCWKDYLEYQGQLIKLENNRQRVNFIQKCRSADIIPRFLKFRIPNNGCFEPTVVHNFQRKLLKEELAKANSLLQQHEENLVVKRTALTQSIPQRLIPSIILHTKHTVRLTREKLIATHSKKLQNLSREQERPLFNVQDTVRICDTDINPPWYVIDTLALGQKNLVLDSI